MTVTINSVSVPTTDSFKTKAVNKKGLQMNPSSVSPVLKSKIVFSLEQDFPHSLKPEDFSVNVSSKTDASNAIKRVAVVAVDDTAKTFTCKFGGAYSGNYNVYIRHKDFGLIDTSSLTLKVESSYSTISTNVASIYGGTLITITGINFGTEITDNPVELFKDGYSNIKCFV